MPCSISELLFYFINPFHNYFASYQVINNSPGITSGQDIWCWEQNFIDVNIGAEDIAGITFVQKGYWVTVISSHDVDAYLSQADNSHVNLKIKV